MKGLKGQCQNCWGRAERTLCEKCQRLFGQLLGEVTMRSHVVRMEQSETEFRGWEFWMSAKRLGDGKLFQAHGSNMFDVADVVLRGLTGR